MSMFLKKINDEVKWNIIHMYDWDTIEKLGHGTQVYIA